MSDKSKSASEIKPFKFSIHLDDAEGVFIKAEYYDLEKGNVRKYLSWQRILSIVKKAYQTGLFKL